MTNYLSDTEKAAIQAFYDNENMREAVKKVLLGHIYNCGVLSEAEPANPMRNRALVLVQQYKEQGSQAVGDALRIFEESVSMVEGAFNELAEYKKVETPQPPKKNQAR